MQENDISIFPGKTLVYATFWERLAAALIDGIILMVINFFISFLFGGSHFAGKLVGVTYNLGGTLAQVAAGWLYCAIQESSLHQATFGKRAMGIKVTDMEGGRASFLQATGRYFGKYISLVTLLIGYLMMLWDSRSQTLHDKMAATLIVKSQAN